MVQVSYFSSVEVFLNFRFSREESVLRVAVSLSVGVEERILTEMVKGWPFFASRGSKMTLEMVGPECFPWLIVYDPGPGVRVVGVGGEIGEVVLSLFLVKGLLLAISFT